MRNLELGNETEKDVFNLVTSAEQREKCYSLPVSQTFGFQDPTLFHWATRQFQNKKWLNNRFMMTWINLQIYTKGVAGVFKGEGGGVLHWIKQRVITSFRHLNIASCASCLLTKVGGGGCHGYKHLHSFLILKSTSHLQWEPVAFCLYFFPQKRYHN